MCAVPDSAVNENESERATHTPRHTYRTGRNSRSHVARASPPYSYISSAAPARTSHPDRSHPLKGYTLLCWIAARKYNDDQLSGCSSLQRTQRAGNHRPLPREKIKVMHRQHWRSPKASSHTRLERKLAHPHAFMEG